MLSKINRVAMLVEGLKERLTNVAKLLIWEGQVSRRKLVREYEITAPRASDWLKEFKDGYPDWVEWDNKEKAYIATDKAYRELSNNHHKLNLSIKTPFSPSYYGDQSLDFLSDRLSQVSAYTFSRINMAIDKRKKISFSYTSMSNPRPHIHTIEPHTLVRAGRRWHVRGYCEEQDSFRDFVIGRIMDIKIKEEPCLKSKVNDKAWVSVLSVRLIPHPDLSKDQQQVIRDEFFMGTSARVEGCRAALLNYFINETGAAIDTDKQKPPKYQMAIENIEECRPWLFAST